MHKATLISYLRQLQVNLVCINISSQPTNGGMACPCGGTHVNDTGEIAAIKIEGIKSKGKVTRVSYSVSAG